MQYPAYGTTSARTASFEYAVGGNPLKLTATDPAGAITTETDLLGRAVKYTDVWGMVTTTTYNRLGQATSSQTTTTAGTSSTDLTYNTDGQVETVKISGILLADPSYTNGQLTSVAYGNGTALSGITRNLAGATTGGVTWAFPSSQPEVTDTVYRSQSGRVVANTTTTGSTGYASRFVYDGAGRLTQAVIPGQTLDYGFAGSGGCGPSTGGGLNGNRTSATVTPDRGGGGEVDVVLL